MPLSETESHTAFAAARAICRRGGGGSGGEGIAGIAASESFAMFFLPRAKRDAVYAVGALCRLIHQTFQPVGGSGGGAGGGACCSGGEVDGIAQIIRTHIDAMDRGRLELPLPPFRDETQWALAAAAETTSRFGIPRRHWIDLIEGLQADRAVSRYATWRALEQHCTRIGGSVAAILSAVLGLTHSDAGVFVAKIGQAARLTSILQTVKSDAARGRIYLPLEDLAQCRCPERDVSGQIVTEPFRALMRLEIARARALFRDGAQGICWLAGDGSRMAASAFVTGRIDRLDAIERADCDLGRVPSVAPLAHRARRLVDAWRLAGRQAGKPLPQVC